MWSCQKGKEKVRFVVFLPKNLGARFRRTIFFTGGTRRMAEIVTIASSIFVEFRQNSSVNGLDREMRVANAPFRQECFRSKRRAPILAKMGAATPGLETNLPPRVSAASRRECVCADVAIWAWLRRIHRHRCTRSRARATF